MRHVVLRPIRIQPGRAELSIAECALEAAALVGQNIGIDEQHAFEIGLLKLHLICL
jgi:hypothetical protein